MKGEAIAVGGVYYARVNRQLARVRVQDIRSRWTVNIMTGRKTAPRPVYDVVNLRTRRPHTFRSPQRFVRAVVFVQEPERGLR